MMCTVIRRTVRTTALAALLALAVATAAPAHAVAADDDPAPAAPRYRFVATPDIFNQDIADVSGEPGWDFWDPNSWTERLGESVDVVLDEIAAQQPGSVLVAGDLVQGHWGNDLMRTGIFGPSGTFAERVANLRRAGEVYHGANVERFASRGLTLHAAVGDHDIGDNPWSGYAAGIAFKRSNVDVFRDLFAQHYTQLPDGSPRYANRPTGTPWRDTAYSVRLHPDVLLISLDEFHSTSRDVEVEVVGGQLEWLERTLATARRHKIPWVVVQGHVPVLTPVRVRDSSALSLERGARSPLWRTMARGGVDLYLAGEVHATTLRTAGGLTQITTGAPIFQGRPAYLTADVYSDRMELTVNEFRAVQGDFHQPIWQGASMKTEGNLSFPNPSRVVGTVTLARNGSLSGATGNLVRYRR